MKVEVGTSEAVYNNQKESPLFLKPSFQIIKFEKIDKLAEDKPRVRVNLSDGLYYIKGILSSSYTSHFDRGLIKNLSLIKLSNFVVRSKNENYFVYIQKLEEFEDCNKKIGNPVNITSKKTTSDTGMPKCEKENDIQGKTEPPPAKRAKPDEKFIAIASLNPFHNKWTIKGRVVLKSDIRHFTTQRGEGKLFSLELADESAQIKVVAFSDAVDIFYPIFDIGKVYTISKGIVKMANKQYSNNNMDYEIHLDKNSVVNQTLDEKGPKYFFSFTKIKDLAAGSNLLDVVGVVKEVYPVSTVTIRSTQKETKKKDIILLDESGCARVTLWGPKADMDLEESSVLAMKSVRASEYNGVCLSTISSSQLVVNPDLDRAFELKGWFEQEGRDIKVVLPKKSEKRTCIREIKDNELEYSFIIGLFIYIKEDNLWYDSCVGEGCNKKVVLEDGKYRCEKCNKVYDECNQRYLVSVHAADFSGQLWANIFNDVGTGLFGHSPKELKELGENSSSQLQNIVKSLYFREYGIKIKGRQDFYNNEPRMKYSILNLAPVDFLEESKKMVEMLDKVASL